MLATRSIRPIRPNELPDLERRVRQSWGSDVVVSRSRAYRVGELDCLVAVERDTWLGVAAYRFEDGACEVVLLEAFENGRGTGTALLDAVADRARAAGAARLWLITTNDNTDALRFYQRRGFNLVCLHPGAIAESRRLKPEIPLVGHHGIPIRDELELERWLVTREPAATNRT